MANIEKRANQKGTTYRVKIRIKGCPTQSATFERLTDAKKWSQQTEAAIHEGRHFKTTQAKKRTVSEMLQKYREQVVPYKKSQQPVLQMLNWWDKQIGMYSLADASTSMIKDYRDKLLSEKSGRGKQRAPGTVNRYLATLSHAFTMAVKEWEWIDRNPVLNVTKPKEPKGRVRFLDEAERKKLLEVCRNSQNTYLYPIVVLALSTGMRQGEILSLQWNQVDLAHQAIILEETKNGETRRVPLVGHALEILKDLSKVRKINTPLLFPSKKIPNKPLEIRKSWNNAVKISELEDFRFHDLRHTAASYLAMGGASSIEIADILGHKTLQMVKRYAHLSENHTSQLVEKMNSNIF